MAVVEDEELLIESVYMGLQSVKKLKTTD